MARNKYPEETVKLIVDQALQLFAKKGYESTSIQDIINNLGGLSKGAIYHHFRSKEEIFEAACNKIGSDNEEYYRSIRDDKSMNGRQKLESMIRSAYTNPTNEAMLAMVQGVISDPYFFQNQIKEIYEVVAPQFIQPIIEQGIADGSIVTDYPKELAEVLITLLNIWLNPVVAKSTVEQMHGKLAFFSHLLHSLGFDLFDDEVREQYASLSERYSRIANKDPKDTPSATK